MTPPQLVELHPGPGLALDIAYARADNFTGKAVYARPAAFLRAEAATLLLKAAARAQALGLALRVFDAFRPVEAQWALWTFLPDDRYVANPGKRGSHHSRGVAIDLTLQEADGTPLDMGTAFDDMTEASWHGASVAREAARNRLLLLGLMAEAGFEHYPFEWWHYQVPATADYPVLSDADAGTCLMPGNR
ncbi:D-alanyl-D-alanine dipeptidase [Zavarzinia sp. CC-PAN008]|uniref:D-alanyl-D-alanine dipeptidase n=1 Tax=Zavarzinia sp. CC-PAN008 TaxID=3243332 RepID=UPI003F743BB1